MADNDTSSFLKLLMPNQKRIFFYIVRLIPNYADAEDVMQEVVEFLWKRFEEYTPNTDFVAWALKISQFKVYEYYKKNKRDQLRLSKETVRILEKESLAAENDYDSHLEAIRSCIQKLKPSDYQLIKLRYEVDEKVTTIATRFGCSVQSIYKHLTRIHQALLLCINRTMRTERL